MSTTSYWLRSRGATLAAMILMHGAVNAAGYRLTDLGTMGGGGSDASGMNGIGTVVGNILAGGTVRVQTGYVVQGGVPYTLRGLTPAGYSRALDINDLGWIAGDAATTTGAGHAVLWKNGAPKDLGVPSGYFYSFATAVNGLGQVVGSASTTPQFRVAFLYERGKMRVIGPGGSTASGINDSGVVIGNRMVPAPNAHVDCWSLMPNGNLQYLPKLGGASCSASAVNQSGDIVGSSQIATGVSHAVLYRQGVLLDLGGLGGASAAALSLNNLGVIVGVASLPNGVTHAALFDIAGYPVDLNSLLDATGVGYEVVEARRVNDQGVIAGTALLGGVRRAIQLTPIP